MKKLICFFFGCDWRIRTCEADGFDPPAEYKWDQCARCKRITEKHPYPEGAWDENKERQKRSRMP